MGFHADSLPDFPWDSLIPAREIAAQYPAGSVDLTIGAPVDPVPDAIQASLSANANWHTYPQTIGTPELRAAITQWLRKNRGVGGEPGILPTVGSKEMVALLPSFLGLGENDVVAFPSVAYPTYDVGARLAGAKPQPLDTDSDPSTWPTNISLLWLNSPGNPDGHVLSVDQLRSIVSWARTNNVIVASDECYGELTWQVDEAPSVLDERVVGDDYSGIFCLYSLSKQSNIAGYRAAFIAGDVSRIGAITEIRKHAGFLVPGPVQAAMVTALNDETHVNAQRDVYRRRRQTLIAALDSANLVNDPLSVAGLYLWVEYAGENVTGWELVEAFARLGIVVAPGDFYGSEGAGRVRISLTASDWAIDQAAKRFPLLPAQLGR